MWVVVHSFWNISDSTELKNDSHYYFKIRLVPPREHAASACIGRWSFSILKTNGAQKHTPSSKRKVIACYRGSSDWWIHLLHFWNICNHLLLYSPCAARWSAVLLIVALAWPPVRESLTELRSNFLLLAPPQQRPPPTREPSRALRPSAQTFTRRYFSSNA
jgi:hypothetical protein